jgi:hypothetical protein
MPDATATPAAADTPPPKTASASTDHAVYCPKCSYDLRGTTSDACPECGQMLDRAALAKSQLPWGHRRDVGRVLGFIKTCWAVSFRRNRLLNELSRPVDIRDAKRFRLVVVALVSIAVMLFFGMSVDSIEDVDLIWNMELEDFEDYYPWLAGLGVVLTWTWLMSVTGLHTLMYDPRDQPDDFRDRCLALSYYLCGPLASLPLAALVVLAGVWLMTIGVDAGDLMIQDVAAYFFFGGLLLTAAILFLFWFNAFRAAGRLARRGPLGQLVIAIGQPLGALLLAAVLFGVVPALGLYIYLLIAAV